MSVTYLDEMRKICCYIVRYNPFDEKFVIKLSKVKRK